MPTVVADDAFALDRRDQLDSLVFVVENTMRVDFKSLVCERRRGENNNGTGYFTIFKKIYLLNG